MKITINEQEFTLKFTYKTFRILAEMWALVSVQAVFDAFSDTSGKEVDVFTDLILACIRSAGNDVITLDEVGDWLLQNMDRAPEILQELTASLPKNEPADVPGK